MRDWICDCEKLSLVLILKSLLLLYIHIKKKWLDKKEGKEMKEIVFKKMNLHKFFSQHDLICLLKSH